MDAIWIYSILTAICLIVIIFITGFEYSWLSSNQLTIELKRKQGKTSGHLLGSFFDNPESFWRTTATVFYILVIIFCFLFTRLTKEIIDHYPSNPISQFLLKYDYVRMVFDLLLCTFISLFFVGIIGKRIFERNPEGKLNTWAGTIDVLRGVFSPVALTFISIAEFIIKYLFNVNVNKKESIFERINPDDFERQSMHGHTDTEDRNREMFQRAIRLTQVKVRTCMTPRNEVSAVESNISIKDLKEKFIETKLSKLVIYTDTLDKIDGYVYHLDLNNRPQTVKEILHSIPAVPETMSAHDLMRLFSKERKSIAWVVDEFGGTAGFVTVDDVLEEVFGNIKDEYDIEEYTESQISDNEFLFSGRLRLSYLNEKYDLNFLLDEAETLSGYIIAGYETIPKQKEKIVIDNYEFEILLVTETKIETVKLKVLRKK